jgi:hypothetical protein
MKGKVTSAATTDPIEGAKVCAALEEGGTTCANTNSSGEYELTGLQEGRYVVAIAKNGYAEFSELVTVTNGHTTTVNAVLPLLGAIHGTVTTGGVPLGHVEVCAYGSAGRGCAESGSNGQYTITQIPAGSYRVSFSPPYECTVLNCFTNYVFQYWKEKLYSTAELVSVLEGRTTESINASLQLGGHITGKVTDAANGQPIAGARVCAGQAATEEEGPCSVANAAGEYMFSGLASGLYEVTFGGEVCLEVGHEQRCTHPWVGQYYQALVSVTAPNTTSGINAALLQREHEKPANTTAPTVTGTPTLGSTLTCSQGSWGNLPTSFTYQWLRNGAAIAGQTATTYTVAIADEGTSLSCTVTATDAAGSTAATSTALAIAKPTPGVGGVTGVSVKGSKASVTLKCTGQTACLGKLELVVHVTVRGHGKHKKATVHTVVIGTAALSIAAGASETVQVHLSSAGQKLLHAAGKKGLKIEFTGSGVTTATKTVK